LPYFFGFGTLWVALLFGGVGLLAAGFTAAKFTDRSPLAGAGRQLLFGGIAVAATYAIGLWLGVSALV
jgi:VIT1/CCC1 family predicted Fe2+/Mn2+ transporter